MKHANLNVTTSPVHPLHEEPGTSRADLTRSEPTHSDNFRSDYIPSNANQAKPTTSEPVQSNLVYDSQREQSDRNRRRADPEFQDGSYGFETKNDQMDIDNNRDTWHASREENSRVREGARPREDRRLYSDNLYSRPRGRGFR